jgi:hypothetical protein
VSTSKACRALWLALLVSLPTTGTAQESGNIAGTVHDALSDAPLAGVQILIDDGRRGTLTDGQGRFRVRELRSGWHLLEVRHIGYLLARRDSILVRGGETVVIDVSLQALAVELDSIVVTAVADPVLDPFAMRSEQRITATDLRDLPVSNLEDALQLQAGVVGESYRGGRVGQQALLVDGLGIKNQLDAQNESTGLHLPPDMLTEASLTTSGFSARYGQTISGLVNVVTKDGGDRWRGRTAYETDRPFDDANNHGLDRLLLQADGPIAGGVTFAGAFELKGRLDSDPVNAPAPANPRDPRASQPYTLPHNSAEQMDLVGKLRIPIAGRHTARLFGIHSEEQRLLFDPLYKYEPELSPARRLTANLVTGSFQFVSGPTAGTPLVVDFRTSLYDREFTRGTLVEPVEYQVGAFTADRFHFVGEDLARRQDTTMAQAPIEGFDLPGLSDRSPWGVPAFFAGVASEGSIGWNHYREWRSQLDATIGVGQTSDVYAGALLLKQQVQTFQRVLGYLPVGDTVPPATSSDFSPSSAAAYVEGRTRLAEMAFTFGLRWDTFDPNTTLLNESISAQSRISPRFGFSTVLGPATVVGSYGVFYQAPDFQFLVDAAFADTTRTGRFRRGNASLGFEKATMFEGSVRARPAPFVALTLNGYVKQLDGLVSSVPLGFDPDSSIFGNADYGNVKGLEIIAEREFARGWGMSVAYTLQNATATSTSAFLRFRLPRLDPATGDTIIPDRVEYPLDFDRRHALTFIAQGQTPEGLGPRFLGIDLLADWHASGIYRYQSGLPYSRTNVAGDSLLGSPNDFRLPSQSTISLLIRRNFRVGAQWAGFYLDIRNLLNTDNVVAVRRDTGTPFQDLEQLERMADEAFIRDPNPIPYESPRYRRWADLDGNGLIEGPGELRPLYLEAATDFSQPLFLYGPPRIVRLGFEFLF